MLMKGKGINPEKYYGIFDLDGTLTHLGDREIFAIAREWDEFNSRGKNDLPQITTTMIAKAWSRAKDCGSIVLTGRSDKWRKDTEYWLQLYHIPYDELIMRPEGNMESDYIFKRSVVHELQSNGIRIIFAFDDRESCIKMYREEGITCFPVDGGKY